MQGKVARVQKLPLEGSQSLTDNPEINEWHIYGARKLLLKIGEIKAQMIIIETFSIFSRRYKSRASINNIKKSYVRISKCFAAILQN